MSPREQNFDMENLYLRFLQIANVIREVIAAAQVANVIQRGSLSELDETSIALLNEIAVSHLNGKALTVSQAMGLANLASATTIHRKLDELRIAGYIEQTFQGSNRRTKYLVPTAATHAYMKKMSEAMAVAARSASSR